MVWLFARDPLLGSDGPTYVVVAGDWDRPRSGMNKISEPTRFMGGIFADRVPGLTARATFLRPSGPDKATRMPVGDPVY
jgi:hypothetical protein